MGQNREPGDPLTPTALLGPFGQCVDDRQRKPTQMHQIRKVALESSDPRRLRLFARERRDSQPVILSETIEAPPPAEPAVLTRSSANHRRLDDELFPLPW